MSMTLKRRGPKSLEIHEIYGIRQEMFITNIKSPDKDLFRKIERRFSLPSAVKIRFFFIASLSIELLLEALSRFWKWLLSGGI